MRSDLTPGPWLRLAALGGAAATLVAVVSGTTGPAAAHSLLSALALPPLVAVAVAAWIAYRPLLPSALAALGLFGAAAAITAPGLHATLAALAFAAALVTCVQAFRGAPASSGPWRDYVTLTKPRIMSLLLVTGAAGMFVGAQGVPDLGTFAATMVGLALACGGASALNHVLDRDLDRLMGKRTERRPVAAGRVPPERALEFGLVLSALSFVLLASAVNVLTAMLALVGNLFYVVVYTRWLKRSTPQNIVIGGAAGRRAAARRLRGRDGRAGTAGALALPDRLPLDAAALLGARAPDQGELRRREGADAAGRAGRRRDGAADRALHDRPGRLQHRGRRVARADLHRRGDRARRRIPLARRAACDTIPSRRRAAVLFHYSLAYLALLFVAAALDPVLL